MHVHLTEPDLRPRWGRATALAAFTGAIVGACLAAGPVQASEDPAAHVQFIEEPAGNCVVRGGAQILVKSRHPTRGIRVWLDRTVAGSGTGDRSRTELRPGAEPEALGCSRNSGLAQGWRLVRAEFVD